MVVADIAAILGHKSIMSRAFVNEDSGGGAPRRDYGLPLRDDPGFGSSSATLQADVEVRRRTLLQLAVVEVLKLKDMF